MIAKLIPIAALMMGAPAMAQVTPANPAEAARGYADPTSPNQAAINAREAPVTSGLNAAADASAQNTVTNQAQYDADRAAYMAALVQHDAAVNRADMRYARQQRAYADAMAVWRVQVADCKRGKRAACDMPPPNVADYY